MKFESKKYGLLTKSGITRILLILVTLNLIFYLYGKAPVEQLIYVSLAMLGVIVSINILVPGKTIITINDDAVTIENGGMVTGNFNLSDVENVENKDKYNNQLIVSTKDNLKFSVPKSGFSDEEITNIINVLRRT